MVFICVRAGIECYVLQRSFVGGYAALSHSLGFVLTQSSLGYSALIRGRNEMHTIIIWILPHNQTVHYIRLRFAAPDREWTDTPITPVYIERLIEQHSKWTKWWSSDGTGQFIFSRFFLSAFRSIFAAILLCETHFLHIFSAVLINFRVAARQRREETYRSRKTTQKSFGYFFLTRVVN